MRTRSRDLVLGLLVVVVIGIAAGAWWLVQASPNGTPAATATPNVHATQPLEEAASDPSANRKVELSPAITEANVATTVVFPLKVELELLASAVRPKGDGVGALGADATARLSGSVHGANGEALVAEVQFVAGANVGRRLLATRDGSFGANDLYPGLSVVQIRASGSPGSLREILLRKDRETLLNVGYGRPGFVQGVVHDVANDPIPDARVTIDGQEARTDEAGVFVFQGIASGDTFAVVDKPGYAAYMEKLVVVAGSSMEKGKLTYVLRKGARLQVTIEERINVDNEAQLFVLPETMGGVRDYPWFRLNPIAIYPGGTKTIEDLPATTVSLRLFHSGAAATPPTRSAVLREGATENVTLHLATSPIVNGVVTQGGKPAAGAEVVLEAPQRSQATLAVLGDANYMDLEREVIPDFPPAVQHAKTNGQGEFVLDRSENISRSRYLHAISSDGKFSAWKLLHGGESRVDLVLEPASGDSEIILRMDGRKQGLPVEIVVDGTPREPQVLPPGRDLHIAGLAPGSWRFTARWNGEPLFDGMILDVHDEITLPMTLPEGAIVGQDPDTRRRSGK